uniref:hydroxymethylglutaryl-CoA lyase n=1 Tax=Angiostrongylus cantonensis TaxID=6313 RepID=A0A0K0D141_ANGCA
MRPLCATFERGLNTVAAKGRTFKVVEVGVRDGLQNEKQIIPADDKIAFINRLSKCGFQSIEATSFVSPKWIPQMADHQEVIRKITKYPGVSYPVLVPNRAGLDNVLKSGVVEEIAVFCAASDSFSKKNINANIEDSLQKLQDVMKAALKEGLRVRGYVSCVIGCPYEGKVDSAVVAKVTCALLESGCYEGTIDFHCSSNLENTPYL